MKKSNVYVPRVKARSIKDIEKAAQAFLLKFAPVCLRVPQKVPIEQFFDQILPKHYKFKPNVEVLQPGIEGLTDCGARTVTLAAHVHEGLTRDEGRARFTTSHEIAHVVLHSRGMAKLKIKFVDDDRTAPVLARRSDLFPYEDPEWQADTFSAALLMPSQMVMALFQKTRRADLINVMMKVFAVSRAAAERRLNTLGRSTIKKRGR